jgi:hypothetical protein
MDTIGRKANAISEIFAVKDTVSAYTDVAKADLSFFQVTT